MLSLIKRDPIFNTATSTTAPSSTDTATTTTTHNIIAAGSQTSVIRTIQRKYSAPLVRITDPVKLSLLLPMLYHAKYDPHSTVGPVMKALWENIIKTHYPAAPSDHPHHQQQYAVIYNLQKQIVAYLCVNLSSAVWRDREAACLGLEALLLVQHTHSSRNDSSSSNNSVSGNDNSNNSDSTTTATTETENANESTVSDSLTNSATKTTNNTTITTNNSINNKSIWSLSIRPSLPELFCKCLAVLDDIRDSTRIAALSYAKVRLHTIFIISSSITAINNKQIL